MACPDGTAQLQELREHAGFKKRTCQRVASQLVTDGYTEKLPGKRGWYRITPKGRSASGESEGAA